MLADWNNSSWIDMSPHSDTLSWFWASQSLLFLLNVACLEKYQQIPSLYGLTRLGLEPTIYRTRGRHANHYTTNAVSCLRTFTFRYYYQLVSANIHISLLLPARVSEHSHFVTITSSCQRAFTCRFYYQPTIITIVQTLALHSVNTMFL